MDAFRLKVYLFHKGDVLVYFIFLENSKINKFKTKSLVITKSVILLATNKQELV